MMKAGIIGLIAGAAAVEGFSAAPLYNGGSRTSAASMSMADGQLSRRAAIFTTLIGAPAVANAQFGGINLVPPALRDAAKNASKKTGKVAAETSDDNDGAEKKVDGIAAKKAEREAAKQAAKEAKEAKAAKAKADADGEAPPPPAPKKEKKEKKEKKVAPAPKADAPVVAAEPKIEKVQKAGASGKEDGRFKDAKVDSLEEKLKKIANLKILEKGEK